MKLQFLSLENLDFYLEIIKEFKDEDIIQKEKFLEFLPDNQKIYLLEIDNNIIGTGTIIYENKIYHSQKKVAHVEDIIILKKFQKKGYGKILLDELIKKSKENNCYKIILNCSKNLISFYQKCGFQLKNVEMSIYF